MKKNEGKKTLTKDTDLYKLSLEKKFSPYLRKPILKSVIKKGGVLAVINNNQNYLSEVNEKEVRAQQSQSPKSNNPLKSMEELRENTNDSLKTKLANRFTSLSHEKERQREEKVKRDNFEKEKQKQKQELLLKLKELKESNKGKSLDISLSQSMKEKHDIKEKITKGKLN